MLVQEKGRLKKMKEHYVHLTFHNEAGSNKAKLGKKDKRKNKGIMKVNKRQIHKELKCYFCTEAGHFMKDCPKRRFGSERKVRTMFHFVLNQILWKCLRTPSG